ncbi:hypothetical protein ACFFV7_33175 [Nonomuraea spiralis]|uniref:Uncharacterized protein n=1 Tax=Nonomuraea spiralis TaxID=46182 RepID=A0ABV5INJ1_9ACTN|nr:hypothetical protein [Nonomuraea spiralis]GGT43918.1 hypothetical protein GCM10010176_104230 [Nonomuraea spiralis]
MGIVKFARHEWTPSPNGSDTVGPPSETIDLAVSLARVVLVNGLASIAGSHYGSFDSLRLEAQLLATALDNTQKNGRYALHRTRAFDCSSLHIKSFIITAAGLGLLTASLESLIIQDKIKPLQIKHFDLMPATTPRGPKGGNSRPDLLINLPDYREMVGEAKGRRNGSGQTTKEVRKFLKKLHEWASTSEYGSTSLALSWASILEDKTFVNLYHTDPTKDVELIPQEPLDQYPYFEEARQEHPIRSPRAMDSLEFRHEWNIIANSLTAPTPIQFYEDPLFWSAPNPSPDDRYLADIPIRGAWSPLGAGGRSIFVGIFQQAPGGDALTRIRQAYASSLEENAIDPLDIAAEGRLLFAVAQDRELATWRALRQRID